MARVRIPKVPEKTGRDRMDTGSSVLSPKPFVGKVDRGKLDTSIHQSLIKGLSKKT